MSTLRIVLTVLATAAATLAADRLLLRPARANDHDEKTACCFKLDGTESPEQMSKWMAVQVSHGHSNFEVAPTGKVTFWCAW